jgi:P27 family predicted phage terminase small subunit
MTRGRKPKPTAKKRLAGNPGKRRLNKREPKIAISADMKIDVIGEGAKTFSDRYKPILTEAKILTDADAATFELMAGHYSIAVDALKQLQKSGLTLLSVMGLKKHPLTQIFRDNSMAFRAYAAEFGMTPSARSRLQVPAPEDPEADLEKLLFGNKVEVGSGSIDQ